MPALTAPTDLTAARSQLAGARRILCDVDGCLMSGGQLLPGAAELVRAAGTRLALVSNNSTDTATTLAARFGALGAGVAAQRIFLAGEQALHILRRDWPGSAVMALAGPHIRLRAAELGVDLTDASPDIVLICRDTDLSYDRLQMALDALAGTRARLLVEAEGLARTPSFALCRLEGEHEAGSFVDAELLAREGELLRARAV